MLTASAVYEFHLHLCALADVQPFVVCAVASKFCSETAPLHGYLNATAVKLAHSVPGPDWKRIETVQVAPLQLVLHCHSSSKLSANRHFSYCICSTLIQREPSSADNLPDEAAYCGASVNVGFSASKDSFSR
jgi:hypothetical protein